VSIKILYVCTYWGVRSQIAKLLTDALAVPNLDVDSTGFEAGAIGGLPRQIMMERGLDLSVESPETLFKFSRKKTEYDYVITLCNQYSQENYEILFNVVDMLFKGPAQVIHWNIPDFMSITAEGDERKAAAEAIVRDIEIQIEEFVGNLNATGSENSRASAASLTSSSAK